MQNENKQRKQQIWDKGYYIALILCIAAVGVSGYLFTTSFSNQETKKDAVKAENSVTLHLPDKAERPAEQPALPAAVSDLPTAPPDTEAVTAPDATPTEPALITVRPVEGAAQQTYSMDHLSYNVTTQDWRTHDGVDYAAATGTEVVAAADGVVESVFDDDFLGKTVTVSHAGGYVTRYSNLADDACVNVGDSIRAGDTLGLIGQTALLEIGAEPHLHFAVYQNGQSVDPEEFLS